MAILRTAHTADLDSSTLAAVHTLLARAFDGVLTDGLTPEHWENCLGGMHVLLLAEADGPPVGHACVVQRRLLHAGRPLRCGYVDGVAVDPDHRGHGHGATLLDEVERLVRNAYPLGALSATPRARPLYTARGWRPWRGTTWIQASDGWRRTAEDDDWVHVLPVTAPLDLTGELVCDARDGDAW